MAPPSERSLPMPRVQLYALATRRTNAELGGARGVARRAMARDPQPTCENPHTPEPYPLAMAHRPLMHLALAVRDEEASRRFYERYFGFAAVRRSEDGTLMMRNADGFSLALGPWDGEARLPPFLHHGFRAESPEAVRAYA